jgi:hypothetical protein
MPIAVLGLGAKLLGVSNAVHSFAKRVPWQVWLAIAAVILLVLGCIWHGHAKESFGNQRFTAGYAKGYADAKADAENATHAVETKGRDMAQDVRSKNDARHVVIDRSAAAVLVRGAGRAACTPVTPAAADSPASPGVDPAQSGLPAVPAGQGQQLIGVPINGATAFAAQNDRLAVDNASWWDWYDRYTAIIAAYQKQVADLTAKQGHKK